MNKSKSFGLVLSGGGVRGVAHIGALMALEEAGIKPDVISGTSAGAIIGSFYASGMPANDIWEVVKHSGWFKIVKPAIPVKGFMTLQYLRQLLKEHILSDSFEKLQIPLNVVATDLNSGCARVFNSGKLFDRVIASSAVPLMFEPVNEDDTVLIDGGLVLNLPVSPIRDNCDFILGINLVPKVTATKAELNGLVKIAARCFDIAIINNLEKELAMLDWVVQPEELNVISKFDFSFSHSKLLLKLGYEHTKKLIPEIERKL